MKKLIALLACLLLVGFILLAQSQDQGASGNQSSAAQSEQKAGTKSANAATEKLDINTASRDELIALKGIGEKYADKIIQNRPYRAKSDLLQKKVIPSNTYNEIKNHIVAHHASGTKTKAKK